eukprot:TRINITY_DN3429_c0_g1_i6.p3 TRINITY_DN3429_c0_g1~~TRINITY_DN3429_c0_g1_i6.p3  ORF type:complete len:201 (+),score=12.94 TRINITY_DN3429_c0_g1_i6:784-1386(+)
MRIGYDATARSVCGTEYYGPDSWMRAATGRTAAALKELNWPEWKDKYKAMREAFASQVWHRRRVRTEGSTRSAALGLLTAPRLRSDRDAHTFAQWATEALNRTWVREGVVPETPPLPTDAEPLARRSYPHAFKFGYREVYHGGWQIAWTDASLTPDGARSAVFLGMGNPWNWSGRTPGHVSRDPAEAPNSSPCGRPTPGT